jgi:aspartyl/asparaginyl beta-hydroxylase (cupin superfamily)
MLTEQFRKLVFEVLEHHLEMLEEAQTEQDIYYHVERCRWATAYLKQNTVHVEINEVKEPAILSWSGRYE